ncbi:hypothetical protein AB0870_14685 [Microbacterium proteolyticum]|uniref:hypothetical protein n=1 Tax=Microbacterium proteolyticum TaxID=1572644 RepID=UPI002417BA4E|nr:hypothetical protein [Microbacterium proteolyticum]
METVIFDRPMHVHYGFIWLYPEGRFDELADLDPFQGQANGLCGAALPGILSMRTGLHTGAVPLRVVVVDEPPPLGDAEDIVGVSFRPTESVLMLVAFHDGEEISLPLRSYRARWSATAMQAGRDVDTVLEDEPAPDRYELCLWPDDDPRADAIIRQGSQTAAYWHSTVMPR